jgi:hypothetical protein
MVEINKSKLDQYMHRSRLNKRLKISRLLSKIKKPKKVKKIIASINLWREGRQLGFIFKPWF